MSIKFIKVASISTFLTGSRNSIRSDYTNGKHDWKMEYIRAIDKEIERVMSIKEKPKDIQDLIIVAQSISKEKQSENSLKDHVCDFKLCSVIGNQYTYKCSNEFCDRIKIRNI